MRYHALACDYDGTLATDGRVAARAVEGLQKLRASGRRLILVTGRELEDLKKAFPDLQLFDRVVAENGALLFNPLTHAERLLAEPPPRAFVQTLRERGVPGLATGRVIVATWHPHETEIVRAIHDLGLELQVIFNKEAVMVLPAGVTKATGLAAGLRELGLSEHNVVGIGDAENDHAFLSSCECAVAVANALPILRKHADLVTQAARGEGVLELIDRLLADDLASLEPALARHHLLIGHDEQGQEVRIPPYEMNLLVLGRSGGGKSTFTSALLERLGDQAYQYCVLDPEGDYEGFEGAMVLGTAQRPPDVEEVMQLLGTSLQNVVVNLVGMALGERPPFALSLLPRLQDLRARTGRPHWVFVDEVHHLLPAPWEPASFVWPQGPGPLVRVSVEPRLLAQPALAAADALLVVGDNARQTIAEYCRLAQEPVPLLPNAAPEHGQGLFWLRHPPQRPFLMKIAPGKSHHRRHSRKYAEGELPPDRSFYFRGPEQKLNLRAQNLILFMQMADGVDDATWLHHLHQGDYSRWFREGIKDDFLADEAAAIEQQHELTAADSRAAIHSAIQRRYTLPASPPLPIPGTDSALDYVPGQAPGKPT